ncbi:MAG TPA: hypothetical protein VM689_20840 [Aliidongia sp.]|nr:hypothetical protein [Aliidongia sp.]
MSENEIPRLSRRGLLFLWREGEIELRLVGRLAAEGEGLASTMLDAELGLAHGRAGRLCGAFARLGIAECVRPGHYRLARDGAELLELRARLAETPSARLDRTEVARLNRLLRAERPVATATVEGGSPSPERLRQGDGFESWQGRDPDGWAAAAPRAIDTLARMVKSGEVPGEDARAARRFQGAFHRAQLDPLKAFDFAKVPVKGSGAPPISERIETARDQVWQALSALGGTGSPAARAIWYVIGTGLSIDEWARRERWGNGRPLHHTVARGIVIGALSALRAHHEASERRDAYMAETGTDGH